MKMPDEESTQVTIGHKGGRVVLNFHGTTVVQPSYIAWTPDEARKAAQLIVDSADCADRTMISVEGN
jgi:hypothetical protein